jgi:hypothetical protein
MKEKKKIETDQWVGYIDGVINGNRGRLIQLEATVEGKKDQVIANDLPLQDLVLDPVGKGDALTIAVGHNQSDYSHIVESPVEILAGRNEMGQVVLIEITDKNKEVTKIKFKS